MKQNKQICDGCFWATELANRQGNCVKQAWDTKYHENREAEALDVPDDCERHMEYVVLEQQHNES